VWHRLVKGADWWWLYLSSGKKMENEKYNKSKIY
jgi:hypothetical protein